MYDIKFIEFGFQTQTRNKYSNSSCSQQNSQQTFFITSTLTPQPLSKNSWSKNYSYSQDINGNAYSSCSILTPIKIDESTHMTFLSLRRRRLFHRNACLFSILAAFAFGLILGVFIPMYGFTYVYNRIQNMMPFDSETIKPVLSINDTDPSVPTLKSQTVSHNRTRFNVRPLSDFPTIYRFHANSASTLSDTEALKSASNENAFSVAFINERDINVPTKKIFKNTIYHEQDINVPNSVLNGKLVVNDGSIREFYIERNTVGYFQIDSERRLPKHLNKANRNDAFKTMQISQLFMDNGKNKKNQDFIKSDIYWGDLVESAMPKGFNALDTKNWIQYINNKGRVVSLKPGCGRMQNRLVVFNDGSRACARYRQNIDQIQGELFSFYLGQLLNLSNLAPSAASVIDLESETWSSAIVDINQVQWKQQRPVVLTRWLPELEPAGIPQIFQPIERHLNKYDIWNITLTEMTTAIKSNQLSPSLNKPQRSLLNRLIPTSFQQTAIKSEELFLDNVNSVQLTTHILQLLVELAQWSDLIVFDYLIANLDRVVNNLYNFQWNADIMAAPAHNLARQINSQLLVFLDNESGLLHGYRLLKKYEAYHGLLLDNLCVFRKRTIDALLQLRSCGVGLKLREIFERTTNAKVRDVLPSLPDKSIKILVDRIDRVLGQVKKCQDLLTNR